MNNTWTYLKYGLATISVVFGIMYLTDMVQAAEPENYKVMKSEMFDPSVQLGEFCSGTLIYSERDASDGKVTNMILTAKHCVDKVGQDIEVNMPIYNKKNQIVKKTTYRANVWGISSKSDLALLKLKDDETYFLNVARVASDERADSLVFAEPVFNVSFPLGWSQTFTEGTFGRIETVDSFSSLSDTKEFFRATPDIAPASSGSPLFAQADDGGYELIGTLTGGAIPFTFISLYTPTYEINAYLNVAKHSYEVKALTVKDLKID